MDDKIRRILDPNQIDHLCPKCGEPVRRIRRSNFEKMVGYFYPSKSYQCSDNQCGWKGLLYSIQNNRGRKNLFRRFLNPRTIQIIIVILGVLLFLVLALVQSRSRGGSH